MDIIICVVKGANPCDHHERISCRQDLDELVVNTVEKKCHKRPVFTQRDIYLIQKRRVSLNRVTIAMNMSAAGRI